MGLLVATVFALSLWIIGWAVGIAKSFDWFLLALAIVVLAATMRVVLPHLPGRSPEQ